MRHYIARSFEKMKLCEHFLELLAEIDVVFLKEYRRTRLYVKIEETD